MARDSTPVRGLYALAFTKPGSTTYRIPGIVRDVSAILVANMTCKKGSHSHLSARNKASVAAMEVNPVTKVHPGQCYLFPCWSSSTVWILDILNMIMTSDYFTVNLYTRVHKDTYINVTLIQIVDLPKYITSFGWFFLRASSTFNLPLLKTCVGKLKLEDVKIKGLPNTLRVPTGAVWKTRICCSLGKAA